MIVRLLRGETVTEKTDWYNLRRRAAATALLHAADHGDGGGGVTLAGRRAGVGAAWHRHAVDRRHQPDAMAKHTQNWGLYEEQARLQRHTCRTAASGGW